MEVNRCWDRISVSQPLLGQDSGFSLKRGGARNSEAARMCEDEG